MQNGIIVNRFCCFLFLLFFAAVPAAAQTPAQPPDKARVQGIVRAADTGEPLRRARVTLGVAQARATPQVSVTDAEGRFAFLDVAPGRYRLSVERNGFVRQEYGQRGAEARNAPLTVNPGQNLDDLEFRLLRAGVITGRVFDEEGDPVSRVRVQVMRYGYEGGRRTLVGTAGESTDDRGEYRIFDLSPGKYFMSATFRAGRAGPGGVMVGGSSEGEDDTYASTYYPGTTDPARAIALELLPGRELSGIDFTLVPMRAIRVRGTVTNSQTGQPARGAQVWLLPRDSGGGIGFLSRSQAAANDAGRFEVRAVTPGTYHLLASLHEGEAMSVGRLVLEVGSVDLEGASVSIGPGLRVEGRIRIEGATDVKLESLRVLLRPRDSTPFFGGGVSGVDADGSFQLDGVVEDTYSISVGRAPEDFYLKSVRQGTEEVLERGLTLTAGKGLAKVELTLSARGARIEGLVLDGAGLPVTGTVVLVPPPARRNLPQLYKSVRTDPLGRFVLRGIAPGDFKLFAFEEVEEGAYQDPEFLRPLEDRGLAVRASEGSAQTLELKVIPAKPASP